MSIPQISVQEVARRRSAGEKFVLLDVREMNEIETANLGWGVVDIAPCSELGAKGLAALPPPARNKDADIVIFCHHGGRSMQVASWLASQGWTNVKNMAGGIDAYAEQVDPTIPRY